MPPVEPSPEVLRQTDHDLLVRLDENMRNLRNHLQTLTGDFTKKIDDHESRIRRLEKYVWLAIGGLAIVQLIVGLVS